MEVAASNSGCAGDGGSAWRGLASLALLASLLIFPPTSAAGRPVDERNDPPHTSGNESTVFRDAYQPVRLRAIRRAVAASSLERQAKQSARQLLDSLQTRLDHLAEMVDRDPDAVIACALRAADAWSEFQRALRLVLNQMQQHDLLVLEREYIEDASPGWNGHVNAFGARMVSFSRDNERIVTCGPSDVEVWDLQKLRPVGAPLHYAALFEFVGLSKDGGQVFTHSGDEIIRRDVGSGRVTLTIRVGRPIHLALLTPDCQRLVTAQQSSLVVWDAGSGARLQKIDQPAKVQFARFSNHRVLTLNDNQTCHLWDLQTGTEVFHCGAEDRDTELPKQFAGSQPAAITADGGTVVTIYSTDVDVWRVSDQHLVCALDTSDPMGLTTGVMISGDGNRVLTAGTNGVRARDVRSRSETGRLGAEVQSTIHAAILTTDGNRVLLSASGPDSGLWEITTGKQIFALPDIGRKEAPLIAMSPDGKLAAVAYPGEEYATLWQLPNLPK